MKHFNKLKQTLQVHFAWEERRVKFLTMFVIGVLKMRTVSLSHLAIVLNPLVRQESNYRRIQNFFQKYSFDVDSLGRFLLSILRSGEKIILTLDRTNWKFGKQDINVLMAAIAFGDCSLPLCWSLLPTCGNSNYSQRRQILERAISLVGKERIKCLVADREFGSGKMFKYLKKEGINFHIRIKRTSAIKHCMSTVSSLEEVFEKIRSRRYVILPNKKLIYDEEVYVGGRRSKDNDYLILASSDNPEEAESCYKKRWTIETMFGNMKSRGFDFEKTHMSDPEKISKLIFLIGIALIWSYLTGIWMKESLRIFIKTKTHGRKEKSIFRVGLDFLRQILLAENRLNFEFDNVLRVLSCT